MDCTHSAPCCWLRTARHDPASQLQHMDGIVASGQRSGMPTGPPPPAPKPAVLWSTYCSDHLLPPPTTANEVPGIQNRRNSNSPPRNEVCNQSSWRWAQMPSCQPPCNPSLQWKQLTLDKQPGSLKPTLGNRSCDPGATTAAVCANQSTN